MREVRQKLQEGRKVLLTGPEGIGKTALIQALLGNGLDRCLRRSLLVCPATTGVRPLLEAAKASCPESATWDNPSRNPEPQTAVPIRPKGPQHGLRSGLYRTVQQGRWLFILDHLSSRDPAIRRVLEFLFDYDVLFLAATRGVDARALGNVAKTVWRWEVVKVPPLGEAVCRRFLDQLTEGWPLAGPARAEFYRRLLRLARGNPGILVEICRRARTKWAEGTSAKIDPHHLWLDWLGERCHSSDVGTG